jgi:hypothetical protein
MVSASFCVFWLELDCCTLLPSLGVAPDGAPSRPYSSRENCEHIW